ALEKADSLTRRSVSIDDGPQHPDQRVHLRHAAEPVVDPELLDVRLDPFLSACWRQLGRVVAERSNRVRVVRKRLLVLVLRLPGLAELAEQSGAELGLAGGGAGEGLVVGDARLLAAAAQDEHVAERLVELDERARPRRRVAGEAEEHLRDL